MGLQQDVRGQVKCIPSSDVFRMNGSFHSGIPSTSNMGSFTRSSLESGVNDQLIKDRIF